MITLLPELACTWSALPGTIPPVQLVAVRQLPSAGADELQVMLAACVSRIGTNAISAIAARLRLLRGDGVFGMASGWRYGEVKAARNAPNGNDVCLFSSRNDGVAVSVRGHGRAKAR